jgi:hypothetical protein
MTLQRIAADSSGGVHDALPAACNRSRYVFSAFLQYLAPTDGPGSRDAHVQVLAQ